MSVSDRIGKLTPEQRAVLRSRLQRKYVEGAAEGAIPRRPDPGSYPLSFAQERLWFLDQLEPGPLYNDYTAYRFTGPLDPALMERGFNEVVRRHEALRATFPAVEGRPLQVVLRDLRVPLPVVDLSALPAVGATAEIGRVSAREVQRPFDLAAGPLVRGLVLRLAATDHLVVLNMHHIVCDGWSAGILNRELTTIYRALAEGRPWQLPELPIQYADYAHWQRQWLRGALGPQLAYWKERLAGAATVLELPTDRPRPKVRTGRGARYYLKLPREVAVGLQDLAQREGGTMFMAQLAGLAALLHRYTGQDDLLIGTPIAGRNRVELEGLIGFFVNTLVLRTDLGGDPDVHRLLARVRETVVGAFAHQDLPFEKLVEEVQPERDLAYTPLFQVMFASQVPLTAGGGAATPFAAGGITMTGVPLDNRTTKFDLVVHFWDEPAGFGGWVEYDTELFDLATIVRLVGHLETLLVGAIADPDRRVSELPLLTAAERAQTLREWNDSRVEHPPGEIGETLYGLFAAAAERAPDAIALVCGGEHLSYAAARRRAEGFARHLASLGVGPDSPVGICVERSPAMPLAVLATLAASGAYVPLDPAYPADRLAFMLADAEVRVLVTEPALVDALPAELSREAAVVLLGNGGQDAAPTGPAAAVVSGGGGPDHLVYVIYTSGTTGRPKGIALPQRTLVNLMRWQSASLIGGRRSLGFASFSFDVFCEELFGALATGGTLCLAPEAARHDPAELERLVAEERIEEAILPVVVLQQLAEQCAGRPAALASLAWVTTTGEAMQLTPAVARLFARLREGTSRPSLHNFYGPAEAHVVTAHTLAGEPAAWPMYPPIGRPVANARIHLLDRGGLPVPIGVPGELHIGGLCLARGYAHQPALTAARFVPDPFAEAPGERLYRTGDLARRRVDGTLEFLGRIDHQVKIRGFRIEPGEIEQALARHPAVRETVVLARDDGPRGRHLVAYVVAEPGHQGALAADELRAFLGASLPDYMVPAAFVRRDALPLTPNGKVDRRALLRDALPEDGRLGTGRPLVPPRDPLEEALAALWVEVLGVERIGVHDDFFGLGGHSLLATQLLSRVRRTLAVDLPLRELFERPTVAALAARVRAARGAAALPLPPLEPLPAALRAAGVPLSFAQQRLWFLDRLQPGSPAYNIAMGLALSGPLDLPALAASLAEIVRRHEALRTTFGEAGGEPFQVVAPPPAPALPLIDLAALPEPPRQAEAHRLAAAEAGRPFDLERGPLFRVRLLALAGGGDEHALLATLHHVVTDGWSMEVLVRELAALYGACRERRASPLPELPIQYGDYAVWQRRWLTGEALAAQLDFWRERLAGLLPLDLPADRPRPPVRSQRGAALSVALPPAVPAALGALGRRYGATLFMTTLAAFQALLSRSSGAEDVAVGTPVAGRTRVEVEGLIGFFVNTLVMRTDLAGDPSFPELLGRVREVALGAQSHAEVPFERLVEELEPERDPSRTPLFQVMFTLQQNASAADGAGLPGLVARPLAAGSGAAKFDLSLALAEGPAGLLAGFEYATDLFDAATMARWAERFRVLVERIVAHPEARLSELPLLADAERAQVLVEWSGGARPYPRERTLPGLFAEQAACAPGAVALSWDDERLTYGELDRWSSRIAHRLRRLGVGPESRVGMCLERSPEMVAAILGILKAGGAYVPLDPAAPAERQRFMLADAGVELLLTIGGICESPLPGVRLVHLDDLDEGGSEPPSAEPSSRWLAPPAAGWPESLAYVMYTSGSTGEPKGVAVTHRGVVRLVRESGFAALGAEEVFLQLAPVGFDASTLELWAPLANGGRLALPPPGNPSLEELGRAIAHHRVTTLWLTAGLFHLMVDERLADLAPLRQLLAGGDVLSPPHVQRALAGLPGVTLINGYGPTENTTFTCCHRMGEPGGAASPVPIGRPIGNTRVHVVDAWLQPAPVGTPGELWTGGDGLARGYLGRPELTAERFVPDAWSGEPGGRLYRTGDLARWRPDGTLEFLGRLDAQVKVRGFRIEPGEVEAALARHPGVRESAVVARDEPGGKRLVAFVVPAGGPAPAAGELAAFLGGLLPGHMIPAAFMALPALPLTANGKVDRRALARLSHAPERPDDPEAGAPRTVVEELLEAIWCAVLGRERVGVEESFFDLGGHSLLATQVVSRIRGAFGLELPLADLFEAPTVAALAARVERARGAPLARPAAPARAPAPRLPGERLPLSFAQQRLWFLDQLIPGSAAYNVPVALQLEGRLAVEALAAALAEIVRRHESLRTTFEPLDGEPWQRVHPPGDTAPPLVDLAALAPARGEAETARLAGAEASRPFDLARGPLFRAALLRLGGESHALLATLHHIVSDGWSMGVLTRELTALYAAFQAGQPSPLPELPVQYGDYARWQRSWLADEVLAAELAAWRERLAGVVPLDLPADRPRPAARSLCGATLPLALPPGLSAELSALGRRRGATLFMTLLAAFQAFLARLSGAEDLAVGTPTAGRTRSEVEGLIGFFVNTLVMRGDLSGDPAFSELLARAREASLFAHAHQEVPFERLVEVLEPERDPSRTPLFQVMLTLQNTPQEAVALPGLALFPLAADTGTAKFDLTLALTESPAGLLGSFEYATDLFDPATVERFAARFATLLQGLAADPEARLSELPLLPAAEWRQVLEWSGGPAVHGADRCLHELFAAQAARTPGALALVDGERRLTYRELDAAANRLAHHLRGLGVGPEVLVGVGLERSAEMVAALLAVLKAGGAYVPFDRSQPAERLAMILADAGVAVLLTREGGLPAAPAPCRAGVVDLDREREAIARRSPAPPPPAARPENLAYAIFTSGSTGRPKGVAIAHKSATALVHWAAATFSDEELAGVLAATSIGFDLSVFELFAPLCRGGAAILAADALALAGLPAAGLVTLVNTVPSVMAELVRMGAVPPSVRTVNLAGEPLRNALVQQVYERCPSVARLLNLYGPTEDTTYSTGAEVARGAAREPTIGRPIAGSRAFVVDARLRPVPVGVPGELALGGAGLARGYLGRPELTAERFVPDPFCGEWCGEPGARLYRTGDLARLRPDGELEFLGRLDHQVKLRGFRIEPGEIEAVLAAHGGVREAVVVVREDASDAPESRRLVAYVVPGADPAPTADELRAFAAARLPAFMLPAAFVALPALPLTANGKVDRRALPAPDRPPAAMGRAAPKTAIEEVLAGFWCEVLGVERVGPDDGFFALGGHSLLATRVVSRVRQALGVELPLREIFEAPTLAGLAARVEAARGAGAAPTMPAVPPLAPAVRRPGERLPLSFAQQRLWFLDLLEPGSAAYNVPGALRAAGDLDVRALARSLSEIVRRHESLRTTFAADAGEPFQVIAPPAPVPLPVIDLEALPAAARMAEGGRLAVADAARPFDLARGPLLRVVLVRLAPRDHAVLLDMHHIVSDAWSLGVFVGELATLYAAYREGRPSPLPEPALQYADFAAWQRRWLDGEALAGQLAYWRRQLAGAPPVLALPADRPRPAPGRRRSAARQRALAPAPAEAVRALGRRQGATLFMTLLAAFDMLLCRWSGQADVVVGSPIASRDRLELEGLIGFFVNTLVLRADLAGDPTGEAVLARVRAAALDAYANQDLPFERLVEELAPQRSLEHTPLFQVLFGVQNAPPSSLEVPGVRLEPFAAGPPSNKFDLNLSVAEAGGGLLLSLSYDQDLFDPPTIDRLLARFEALLAGLAADPGRRFRDLPLLAAAEEHQVRVEWGRGPARPPGEGCVHRLFEAHAARAPEALALVFEEERLTYGELERRSALVARRLAGLGVGPEVRVGIAAERSAAMIVGMLGVLRAGGAYVPLDPAFPVERLAAMAADAGVATVLAQGSLRDLFAGRVPRLLDLEAGGEAELLKISTLDRNLHKLRPENLAYVLFTSGSTGRPKGVAVEHRQLANYTAAVLARLDLPGPASFATVSTLAADLGNTSVFAALASGGTLHVLSTERAVDPVAFGEHLGRWRVDCLKIVPSHLRALLAAAPEPASVLPRQRLVLGGEALPWPLADQTRALAPGCTVLNHYGPTESTVGVLTHRVRPGEARHGATVPLGRPLANVTAVIVDDAGRPVPAGAPGELCLGGAGLARGYLGRPDLTAERFVPDPYGGEPGARLYRTGDLARHLPDGSVEFLGRIDQQVKIRGFRVEPGEVEALLASHPAVREVAVIALDDPEGARLLAAFVPEGEAPAVAELREHLRQRLPEHMVPAAFVALAALPLTPNGKLDRAALVRLAPAAASAPVAGGEGPLPPRDALELELVRLWEELLKVRPVGVRDGFFDLGGHSLLAVALMARIRERFGRELPLATLFRGATVESLAAALSESGLPSRSSPLVAIEPRGDRPPLISVHPVGGGVFCYAGLARALGPDQPFYAFQFPGLEGAAAPRTVEEMADLYLDHLGGDLDGARPREPRVLVGWSMGGLVAFEMARRLAAQGERVPPVLLIDTTAPGSVDAGPLDEPSLLAAFARDLAGLLGRALPRDVEASLHGLALEPALLHLLELAREADLLPPGIDLPGARRLFETFRQNHAAARRYAGGAHVGRVVLLKADGPRPDAVEDPTFGWGRLAAGVEVHRVAGDHYSLLLPPHVEGLAERLGSLLNALA